MSLRHCGITRARIIGAFDVSRRSRSCSPSLSRACGRARVCIRAPPTRGHLLRTYARPYTYLMLVIYASNREKPADPGTEAAAAVHFLENDRLPRARAQYVWPENNYIALTRVQSRSSCLSARIIVHFYTSFASAYILCVSRCYLFVVSIYLHFLF